MILKEYLLDFSFTCAGSVILETVLLRSHHVATLVLSHLDLPLPGGGGGPGVNVNVDLVALVGGGDVHVLTSVVATDDWRNRSTRVGHGQGVGVTISNPSTISDSCCGGDCGWI